MIKLPIILLILNLSILSGCNRGDRGNNSISIVNVNPFNTEKIKLSSFTKTIRYIALETKLGHHISGINKIFFINGRFYIIDSFHKSSIFCFDDEGKFIFEIGKQGKGPGEYVTLSDAEISYDNKSIIAVDQDQKKYISYDLDGRFIKEERIPAKLYFENFCMHKDFNILLSKNILLNEAIDTSLKVITQEYANKHFKLYNYISSNKSFSETYIGFKPCNLLAEGFIRLLKPFDLYKNQIYSTYPYNDTIFLFDKMTCIPKFYVDFGVNKIPAKLIKDETGKTYHELYHNKELRWAGILDHLVIAKKFIAFSYATAFKVDNSALYITSNKQTINFNQIDNDINNGSLGIVVGKYSDDTVISYIDAYKYIEEFDKSQNNSKSQNLRHSIDENSNPVIVLTTIN